MAEEKDSKSILPISGLVVLLAALGITVFSQAPFRGVRPPVPEIRESCGKIDARLWQDPFSAVSDHLKSLGMNEIPEEIEAFDIYSTVNKKASFSGYSSVTEHQSLAGELNKRIRTGKGNVTVLGVMVFGSRYEEDTEQRTRNRYAVLSGLSRVGFVPADPEHLGFVRISAHNRLNEKKITLSNMMPYEWLKIPGKEDESLLLLWINDQLFEDKPLIKLGRLMDNLGLGGKPGAKVRIKIIGPAGSTTLKGMLEDVASDNFSKWKLNYADQTDDSKHGIEIYSPFATVDDSLLPGYACPGVADNQGIENTFKNCGVTFTRTIGTDRGLADKLFDELRLRRVNPVTYTDHILLVAEWDTDYGRSLPQIFTTVLTEKEFSKKEEVRQRVHTIKYMRGIDGNLPGEKEENKQEKTGAKSKPEDETKKLEQPTGKSQFDYLRRLAQEARQLDEDLKVNKKGSIMAIGVLGSDFYDKYLVIQALRQQFPGVVYFTTDLDARFFHPDNFKYTRNLLVASSFDLALREDLQGGVPPFRDNYQTSAFYATLLAFADYLKPYEAKSLKENGRASQMYEIGRYGAVNLDDPENTVNPAHQTKKRQLYFIAHTFIILGLLAILLLFTSIKARKYAGEIWNNYSTRKPGKLMVFTGIIVIVAAAACVLYLGHSSFNEEIFSFFNGTSSWPSALIRLISTTVSISFLYKAGKDLENNRKDIAKYYFGRDTKENVNAGKVFSVIKAITNKFRADKGLTGFVEMVKEYWKYVKFDWEINNTKDLYGLWNEYASRDSYKYRIVRIISIFILFVALCFFIIYFSGFPMKPIRGPISYACFLILLSLSIISFVILIFYVFDVTLICRQFIANASDNKPIWPEEAMRAFAGEGETGKTEETRKALEASWSELRLVQLMAKRTEAVGKLIFYPLIVWFILFVAYINYFDNWEIPLGLASVICLSAVYAWSCAFSLRRAAENARSDALRRLRTDLQQALFLKNPDKEQVMRIRFTINEIKSIREGAFLPFMQHPVVQALFVPFGGTGLVYLFDFLQK